MADANQEYFDAAVRHQIGIRRFASGEARRVLDLLERADRDLVAQLRQRLGDFTSIPRNQLSFTDERYVRLLEDIREARKVAMAQFKGQLRPTLQELATMEAGFEERMITAAVPIEVNLAAVAPQTLRSIVTSKPFQGKLLRTWFNELEMADRQRLTQAIQLGLTEGETVDQIVRRVAGTRRNRFTDGVLSITRRNAEAVTRTAINHVSNSAREALWQENQSVVSQLRWTATLDGRTSAVCRARDGQLFPANDGPRPPAHINCRSVMVAVLDGVGVIGNRPTVRDTRTRRRREIDFRAEARRTGRPIQEVRRDWANKNIGRTPAATSYDEWLRRQPAAFQDEVMGQTKGKLFRQGKLSQQAFVDRRGNELTLAELARTRPEAFVRADLDPDSFL